MTSDLFYSNNQHRIYPEQFAQHDPQLARLSKQIYAYEPKLIDEIPIEEPGIYTLGGARQIGKTTLLKLWMNKLLSMRIPPESIYFMSGELIPDHFALLRLLQDAIAAMPSNSMHYLVIDEITYIDDWDKTIKYCADTGLFENCVLLLSGSDLVLMQEARMRFPGRRGRSSKTDFHYYPLSFREFVGLIDNIDQLDEQLLNKNTYPVAMETLYQHFHHYLLHGGYLTAINDLARDGTIIPATFNTYSDWIRGDMQRRGKQEHSLREIIASILKRYGTQVSWNALAKEMSIDHPATVSDYINLLCSMDATYIQSALLEDKLTAAPKKAKKVIFTDPFIYHAMVAWITPCEDPFHEQIVPCVNDSESSSVLVEATVISHFRRFYPTYYIKAEGEVDLAYIRNGSFFPIEIKWTNQLRAKDLKQVRKYKNALLYTKQRESGDLDGLKTIPLPLALLNLMQP